MTTAAAAVQHEKEKKKRNYDRVLTTVKGPLEGGGAFHPRAGPLTGGLSCAFSVVFVLKEELCVRRIRSRIACVCLCFDLCSF